MKNIIITEAQFNRLFEASVPAFDNGDVAEYQGSQVSTTATVHGSDGDAKYGKPTTTDKVAKSMTSQNYWLNLSNNANHMK